MTWQNSNYSGSDIMSMQQDAIRRVQEMQRLSKSKVLGGQQAAVPPSVPPVNPKANSKAEKPHSASIPSNPNQSQLTSEKEPAASRQSGNFLKDLLGSLNLDHDRMIILVLLIVLLNEGADSKLLLALCYLLL